MGGVEAKGTRSGINVTPLIDVLLVLLIIFMVIQPSRLRGLEAQAPQPSKEDAVPSPRTIVVQVQPVGSGRVEYRINEDAVEPSDLVARLTDIFKNRSERVMFVKGDKGLNFGEVLPVIDGGHRAGVDTIGIITPAVEVGK